MIQDKDVVLAAMGAAAALGGFVLVFLGVIIATYQSYQAAVPEAVVKPYRTAAQVLFLAFGYSLITVLGCLLWLLLGGRSELFGPTIGLFVIQLIVVVAAAGWTLRMVIRR